MEKRVEKSVEITTYISVTVDETKFTSEFMEEFRKNIHPFQTIDDHRKHLAGLEVRGLLSEFVEGYGNIKDFGIEVHLYHSEIDIYGGTEVRRNQPDA